MVKWTYLKMVLTEGKTYKTTDKQNLIIEKIGTNSTGKGRLVVDETGLGDIKELVAPLHKTETNLLGPLELGDLYYAVPKDTEFSWEGDSGSKCILEGKFGVLAPGEADTPEATARYRTQDLHHLRVEEGVYSLATDAKFVVDAEHTVYEVYPDAKETFKFRFPLMFSIANYTPAEGEVALRLWLQPTYLDSVVKITKMAGIDVMWCPRPPKSTTEFDYFTLERFPITVDPLTRFRINVRNVKGADISPPTGAALSFTVTTIAEYRKVK